MLYNVQKGFRPRGLYNFKAFTVNTILIYTNLSALSVIYWTTNDNLGNGEINLLIAYEHEINN